MHLSYAVAPHRPVLGDGCLPTRTGYVDGYQNHPPLRASYVTSFYPTSCSALHELSLVAVSFLALCRCASCPGLSRRHLDLSSPILPVRSEGLFGRPACPMRVYRQAFDLAATIHIHRCVLRQRPFRHLLVPPPMVP